MLDILARRIVPAGFIVLAALSARQVVSSEATFNAWLALVLGTVVAFHVVLLPTSWLPSMALAVHVLVPAPEIPVLQRGLTPSVGVVIMLVWVVRRLIERYRLDEGMRLDWRTMTAPTTLGFWLLVGLVLSSNQGGSLSWTFTFGTSLLMFAIVPVVREDADLLLRTWVVVGTILAVHVAIEFLVQGDLLYGWFYRELGVPSDQHWSTYRPEASFRHPLSAALFLSVSACISMGEAVRRGRGWYFGSALLCAVAAGLTLSRGALIGLVVGVIAVWALWSPRRFPTFSVWRHTLGAVVALSVICSVNFGPLAARLKSVEAARSSETRWEIIRIAWRGAVANAPFGSGPGTSQSAVRRFNPEDLPIESSMLQLLVSVGVIGLVLFLLTMALVVRAGVQAHALGAVAGLICYLIGITLFNVAEAKESMLLLGGLLILAARRPSVGEPPDAPESVGAEDSETRRSRESAEVAARGR